MIIKAKCSKSREWGFVEKYDVYRYNSRGYVKALTAVTTEGVLAPAYAFKGDEFIGLKDIDEEVGIDRYIKAKKPFYSKLKEGFLVVLKAEVDFVNKEYIPEKSSFEVYTINGNPSDLSKGLPFKKVLDVPKEFSDLVQEPLRVLGESFGSREEFLRSRISSEIE